MSCKLERGETGTACATQRAGYSVRDTACGAQRARHDGDEQGPRSEEQSMAQGVNIGVVGATGQVGAVVRRRPRGARLPGRLDPVASHRRARRASAPLPVGDHEILVEDASTASYAGIDVALFTMGSEAFEDRAPCVAEAGAVVIDNSSAWRMDPDVPARRPRGEPDAIAEAKGIIANPNCTTIQMVVRSSPCTTRRASAAHRRQHVPGRLRRRWPRASTSSTRSSVRAARSPRPGPRSFDPRMRSSSPRRALVHDATIAFNVAPASWIAGRPTAVGETDEEQKMRHESRKILGIPDLHVAPTCVRVPVFTGHSMAINAEFERPLAPERATELLQPCAGRRRPSTSPHRSSLTGADPSYVGRIRRDETAPNGTEACLLLFVSNDNLRKGAALNAVQIAERLSTRRVAAVAV